jgi:hypothetical protein
MSAAYIDASDVSIDVKEGKVTLEGTVPERRMKHRIEDMVDDCMGVQDIDNRIRVSPGYAQAGQSASETTMSVGSPGAGSSASGQGMAGGSTSAGSGAKGT